MYAKLIDGNLINAPRKIRHKGRWYFNANESIMRAEGYKPVVSEEMPEYREGYEIVPTYRETEREIHIYYVYEEIQEIS